MEKSTALHCSTNILLPMSDTDVLETYDLLRTIGSKKLTLYPRTYFNDAKRLPPRPFIVLYELTPNVGHWILVHDTSDENGESCIEFFDSYGLIPEVEQHFISPQFRETLGDSSANLLRLLWSETGGRVIFNCERLQGPNTATCGRHCIARLLCANKSIDSYIDSLRWLTTYLQSTPDELVTYLTLSPSA